VDTPSKTRLKQEDDSLVTEKDYERGEHPNSQSNLKPFEKGVSGNPSGRPSKQVKLKEALMKYGDIEKNQWGNFNSPSKNLRESVLLTVWFEADKGSIQHLKLLAELGCLNDE
jgi:hypothetical protein